MTRAIRRGSPPYPPLLAAIHDPPARLYVRGTRVEVLERVAVAVIGARACSPYGALVARSLGRELGRAGVTVVSGLARGVDVEAHRGALEAGGTTIAVLGCGIDRDYPRANAHVAAQIAAEGLVLSEYPPGTEPAPWRFPARNRIVAGLSTVVVVVEARERSGALITADLALSEGREVMAVPGEITSALSRGTNGLLRQGATPVVSPLDVLEALGIQPTLQSRAAAIGPDARAVLRVLEDGPADPDAVGRRVGLPAGAVAAALVELELAGLVSASDGLYRGSPA